MAHSPAAHVAGAQPTRHICSGESAQNGATGEDGLGMGSCIKDGGEGEGGGGGKGDGGGGLDNVGVHRNTMTRTETRKALDAVPASVSAKSMRVFTM